MITYVTNPTHVQTFKSICAAGWLQSQPFVYRKIWEAFTSWFSWLMFFSSYSYSPCSQVLHWTYEHTYIYIYINIYIYTFSFKKNGSWDSPLCESVTWNLLHWFVLYYSAAFPPAILWSKCCWSYLHDAVLSYHAVVATASENCSTGILQESRFGGVFFNF